MYNKLKYIAVKAQPAALLCHIMIGIFDILIPPLMIYKTKAAAAETVKIIAETAMSVENL